MAKSIVVSPLPTAAMIFELSRWGTNPNEAKELKMIGGHDFLIKFSVLTYDRAYHYLSAVFNGFENTFISLVEYRDWIVAKIANFSGQSKVQRRFLKITKMVNNHFRMLPRVY